MFEVQVATPDLQVTFYRMVHEVWPFHADIDEHVRLRLASIQHQRATWFVGRVNGEVACGCCTYPFEMYGPGGIRPVRAFGTVFSSRAYRGQGLTTQLLRTVMQRASEQENVQDFTLFSLIDPGYYARLGFQCVPSYLVQFELSPDQTRDGYHFEPMVGPHPDPGPVGCKYGYVRQDEASHWILHKYEGQEGVVRVQVFRAGETLPIGWILARASKGRYTMIESNLLQGGPHWQEYIAIVKTHAAQLECTKVWGRWTAPEPAPSLEQVEIQPDPEEQLMWASMRGKADPWYSDLPQHGFRVFMSEEV